MISPCVELLRLRENAVLPCYKSTSAAGADLAAAIDSQVILESRERAAIGTGLALAIPAGYEGQIRPRSGAALRQGMTVVNAPGTIDADYRGEIKVLLINLGEESVIIEPGQRIAQLVIAPVVQADFAIVTTLSDTQRGTGGFGSTGHVG